MSWFIDCDSHFEEDVHVFETLSSAYADRKPCTIEVPTNAQFPLKDRVWFVDGRLFPHFWGFGPSNHGSPASSKFAVAKPIHPDCQSMRDPELRLSEMDKAGIAKQVNFPTLFLEPLTDDLEYEAALMRAYNDWCAEASSAAPDRLAWAALVPIRHPEETVAGIERAVRQGASAIYTLGTAGGEFLHAPQFDPVWAACQHHGLPVTVHIGWAHTPTLRYARDQASAQILSFEQSMVQGFFSFVGGGILDRFPTLKVGFLEGGLELYPAVIARMEKWRATPTAQPWPAQHPALEYVRQGRVFFSTEGDEASLPQAIDLFGAEALMLTADFPHIHFEDGQLCRGYEVFATRKDVTSAQRVQIATLAAQAFYDFEGASLCEEVRL